MNEAGLRVKSPRWLPHGNLADRRFIHSPACMTVSCMVDGSGDSALSNSIATASGNCHCRDDQMIAVDGAWNLIQNHPGR